MWFLIPENSNFVYGTEMSDIRWDPDISGSSSGIATLTRTKTCQARMLWQSHILLKAKRHWWPSQGLLSCGLNHLGMEDGHGFAALVEVARAWCLGNRVATARVGRPRFCHIHHSYFPMFPRPPKPTQLSFIRDYLHLQFTSSYTVYSLHMFLSQCWSHNWLQFQCSQDPFSALIYSEEGLWPFRRRCRPSVWIWKGLPRIEYAWNWEIQLGRVPFCGLAGRIMRINTAEHSRHLAPNNSNCYN